MSDQEDIDFTVVTKKQRTGITSSVPTNTARNPARNQLAQNQLDELNNLLVDIINGQEDITIPANQSSSNAQNLVVNLNGRLTQIITQKQDALVASQQRLAAAEAAEMAEQEARILIDENTNLINQINVAMASSNERLNREQRRILNENLMQLISDSITAFEVNQQLNQESSFIENNIKGLFNGLIQYYTEMASYGYERSPEILAKIGSIIAGSVIIGGTIYYPNNSITSNAGGLLLTLSKYLQITTLTASGLYFLKQGGLPIIQMLENVGARTQECLRSGCQQLNEQIGSMWDAGIDKLKTYLAGNFEDDMLSQYSESQASQASTAFTASTASSAKTAIESILNEPEVRQIDILLTQSDTEENVESQLTQGTEFDSQEYGNNYGNMNDIDGGKIRKSRRHMKIKKMKTCKKGRKRRRITKKGRKYHKTLKRYKPKMCCK